MSDPKPNASTMTRAGDPVSLVCSAEFEYIAIVGTENHSYDPANKAMFMHSALRKLKEYPNTSYSKKVVLIFNDGYSDALMKAFKHACLAKGVLPEDFHAISTRDELISYISGIEYRQIKQLDIFAHGHIGELWFGLTGDDVLHGQMQGNTSMDMNIDQVKALKPSQFSITANIYIYACRVGNGNGSSISSKQNSSLAQAMANATKTNVYAFMRRSNYDGVLGDAEMRADYYRYTHNWRQLKHPIDAATAPPMTEAQVERAKAMKEAGSRRKPLGEDKAIFDPEGALMDVRAGDTPNDVPANLFLFKPAGSK